MTPLLQWLLDLQEIRLQPGAPLSLRWQAPWAPWVLLLTVLFIIAYVATVYRRDGGGKKIRYLLAGFRVALILIVVALLCQPVLVLERYRTEQAVLPILIDASASMARQDRYTDPETRSALVAALSPEPSQKAPNDAPPPADIDPAALTRADLLKTVLLRNDAEILRTLAADNDLALYQFAGRLSPLAAIPRAADPAPAAERLVALSPAGQSTDVGRAVEELLDQLRGSRLAGIVIASDGRNTTSTDWRQVIETADQLDVPVHTVLVGSPVVPRDLVVGPVQAEQAIFVKDLLAVKATVTAKGFDAPTRLIVRLFENDQTEPLAESTIELAPDTPTPVELRTKPTSPGRRRYRVHVEPLPEEVEPANNTDVVEVRVVDDKIRLLYVDAYPRYEYRYLKNALLREDTITASCLLLSADENFAQEGDEPIRRFPETPEELNRYDVVLFGDVDPRSDWITDGQMKMLLDFVANRGGGFGLIAGENFAPHRYANTPLVKLLPIELDPNFFGRYEGALTAGFPIQLTLEGQNSPIFRFLEDPNQNQLALNNLPYLYWISSTLGPRPGAEVLAEHPDVQTLKGPMPIVVVGRYGAGKLFFQATDDTWRWRRHTGEFIFDSYWLQVARYLTQGKLVGRDRRFTIETDRRDYDLGAAALIRLTVLDAQARIDLPEFLEAQISDQDDRPIATVKLNRLSQEAKWFEGAFTPDREGSFFVTVALPNPMPGEKPPVAMFRATRAGREAAVPQADHDTLRSLAAMAAGQAVPLADFKSLAQFLPDKSIKIPDDLAEPLWDTKLVIALFVLLITAEWILRKAAGMT